MTIDILETYTDWCLGRALVLCVRAPTGHAATRTSDISGDTFCHEYHLVWLPPAPAAPPRLILCSSKGTLVKVSSASSAARDGRGFGSGAAAGERKTLWRSSLPRLWPPQARHQQLC